MASSDWDWSQKENVVVPAVEAVAVYTNPKGDIVIRQQDSMGEDDPVIVIPRARAKDLATAIRKEAAKPFEPDE
ncbi:MAG: hypothetical protein EOO21_04270 [Comamonadaceae bacterium]|nr:MAG: hypothetical protein EOO21_04270 [Comamonadaceae bacterium]